ncbi:MAG: uroporphyrinogen-III decarboxylase-like protein, partial [Armatimonadota bacterium]
MPNEIVYPVGTASRKETMTPRERWLAVLNREKPDRIPMDMWATGEAVQKLLDHMGCDHATAMQRLHIDLPTTLDGRYIGPPPEEGVDIYGLKWQTILYESGIYREPAGDPPLAKYESPEEIEANYRWPSPDDFDFSHLPEAVKKLEDRPIRGGGSEPFLLYKLLRGEEQAFIDLIENPDIVDYCLDKMFGLCY